ncbi:uncharacterized protein LOC119442179 isoform X1 [Dermacentor silvarum]|uniref:uncharacterized protein LOC119442179 isoform X1 n=1 Tax=Dermacentor silvarum TaxID=543639 RepID=UPI00189B7D5E|nr:uncharacterized protein LOC119442179 isoform X1 [Dermacentor silvarum]
MPGQTLFLSPRVFGSPARRHGTIMASRAMAASLVAAGLILLVVSAEEPDFMNQVMPVICAATQNLTRRIWYLACVEYLMEYGLENDANYCFSSVNTQTWEEAFGFFCGDKEEDKHHFLMQCFSDRINENVMYDARDVDKMLRNCKYRIPPD